MQELRKGLQEHFKTDDDPLPFKPEDKSLGITARYEPTFRVDVSARDTDI